jgi:hypothetical protein
MKDPQSEAERRKAIAWAIALTAETELAPDHYETGLLERYAKGYMSLSDVLHALDHRVHHLLYRSQAVTPLSEAELAALVDQSQEWNDQHHITGLLCYSQGQFVQVLEGSATDVHALYDRIRRDKRHHQVQTLSDYATATRWFADWRMAFVGITPHEFYWLLGYLEAKGHNLARPHIPIDSPYITTLLQAFSEV